MGLMKIGIIGAGKMGLALLKGFLDAGLTTPELVICSAHKDDSAALKSVENLGCESTADNKAVVDGSDVILLAVKPHLILAILEEVRESLRPTKLVISIALGVTLSALASVCPPQTRIVRVMPNTPCMVRCGATGYARGTFATDEDCKVVESLFAAVGTCDLISETDIDAVTAISGCGPAYFFMALEALGDAGVRSGLRKDFALKLAAQTMQGAAKMYLETSNDLASMRSDVCSPGGATIDAVYVLEEKGFRASLMSAVDVAFRKSRAVALRSGE